MLALSTFCFACVRIRWRITLFPSLLLSIDNFRPNWAFPHFAHYFGNKSSQISLIHPHNYEFLYQFGANLVTSSNPDPCAAVLLLAFRVNFFHNTFRPAFWSANFGLNNLVFHGTTGFHWVLESK